jgi:hypothetical protein
MAQPDIVIDSNHTTVVEPIQVGSGRTADPNITLRPGGDADIRVGERGVSGSAWDARLRARDASLELGGGNGTNSTGRVTLNGGDPNAPSPLVTASAAADPSADSTVEVAHSTGPSVSVTASEHGSFDDAAVALDAVSGGAGYGATLFAGRRGGNEVSGLEAGSGQASPSVRLVTTHSPFEVRTYPQLTAGKHVEGDVWREGEITVLGRKETRSERIRLYGGQLGEGGVVSVRDESARENVELHGQEARVTVGGTRAGEVQVLGDPQVGAATVRVEGRPANSTGSRITMRDGSLKTNVELRADEGLVALGSSTQNANSAGTHGKLTLDDGTGDTLEIRAEDGTITFETDSEGKIFEIETTKGSQAVKTAYPLQQNSL